MDILRQGQHVEVLVPQELRGQLIKEPQTTLKKSADRDFRK